MNRDEEYWVNRYKEKNALWIHDGNPKRPHAELTSGMHSTGFFNSRLVTTDKPLLREAASNLIQLFEMRYGGVYKVQRVVGPQTGATKLAETCSDLIAYANTVCRWASPEKVEKDGKKSMVFSDQAKALLRGKRVLPVEDVVTTGDSVDLMVDAVRSISGTTILPFILVLVNRSGLKEISGKKIVALIDRAMPMSTPQDCELCKLGSVALRPKDNWERLNASY